MNRTFRIRSASMRDAPDSDATRLAGGRRRYRELLE
jgi:hypothetical protein